VSTYPNLDAYNADIEKARNAYAADMAVQQGLCAVCQTSKKDGHMRRCGRCRRAKIAEGGQ
jgi:hypothetical protein